MAEGHFQAKPILASGVAALGQLGCIVSAQPVKR